MENTQIYTATLFHTSKMQLLIQSLEKAARSLSPADFRNVVMLSQSIQVPVEVLGERRRKKTFNIWC